jgi:OOP family OmpA-OmpF porin
MIKKSTLIGVAGIAAISMGTAFAGGPDVVPVVPQASDNGVYIQGDVGYVTNEWKRNFDAVNWGSNDYGSFVGGGALGYQWNRFLAAEVGAFFMPEADFRFFDVNRRVVRDGHVSGWFAYLAGKLMAPVPWVDNLDAYLKAGIAYRQTSVTNFTSDRGDWRPAFAAGGQYNFSPNWYVEVQWMHVGEGSNVFVNGFGSNAIPALNLFTIGAGYKFTF